MISVVERTMLQRELAGEVHRRAVTPLDAFAEAKRIFQAGEPLDMSALATRLGVGRATLYRWTGGKDELLGEVLGHFADRTFAELRESTLGTGPEYVVDVYRRFVHGVRRLPGIEAYLRRDGEDALRLLTSKHGTVQRRVIAGLREMLEEQIAAGSLPATVDTGDLAYAMVRIAESFLYADMITGAEPDPDKAADLVRLLLRGAAAS